MELPLVTVGIVSYNRLHYLRSLIVSLRACLDYPSVQWILVDGNSEEPGLREYVESLDFFEHRIFKTCTHAEAMNIIVERSKARYVMILPEDVQFILKGRWMEDLVELVERHAEIGHVVFNVQRQCTIREAFGPRRVQFRGREVRLPFVRRLYRVYRTASGREFLGFGGTRDGIAGAGILSFGRTSIWTRLGPWRARQPQASAENDSSLGAEADMLDRFRRAGLGLESVMMRYPVAADILTDPRGTKARVRAGNRRYGRYVPAGPGDLYYEIHEEADLLKFVDMKPAPGFETYVIPRGFELPLDSNGDLLKVDVINDAEPFDLIGADHAH